MRFNQPRNVKKNFADFINKVFSLNTSWVNSSIEVMTLTEGNSPQAFEQYPWDNEKYPLVVLFSDGVTEDKWGIDSFVGTHQETLQLGQVPRKFVDLSKFGVSAGILPKLTDFTVQSASLLVKTGVPYEGPIHLTLHSDSAGVPGATLASGSIRGKRTVGIEWLTANIRPHVKLLKNSSYHLVGKAPSGSYLWFVDDSVNLAMTPVPVHGENSGTTWTMSTGKTPVALLKGPASQRVGGGIESSIRVFVEAKDLSTAQKISDLLFVYLHLAKHSNIGRDVKLVYPSSMSMDYDFMSKLSDDGIYINTINKGVETVRTRGNDRLFSIDLSVSCYTNWTEDFKIPNLESVHVDIEEVQLVLNRYC